MSTENKSNPENEAIDYGQFLTTSTEDVQTEDAFESSADPDYYRPSVAHKEAKDRVYKGRGRFVPNVLDRDIQKVSKYIFCLPNTDSDNNSKFYVDVPEGEGAKKNLVTQAFFALKDHESVHYQAIAKEHFSRKMYHWMLYLVMSDIQEPEMVGKVKIFRFGKKIDDKIVYEAKIDDSVGKKSAIAVHDPFDGKDLILHINEITNDRGQKMTSYDQSKFDELSAISLDGGATRLSKSNESMKAIYEYLQKESPDLSKAAHKPWTEEEEEKIINTVRYLVDDDVLFNQIYKKAYNRNFFSNPGSQASAQPQQKKVKEDEVTQSNVDFETDNDGNSAPEIKEDATKTTAKTEIKENKTTESVKEQVIKEDKQEPAANATEATGDGDVMEINVDFEEDN